MGSARNSSLSFKSKFIAGAWDYLHVIEKSPQDKQSLIVLRRSSATTEQNIPGGRMVPSVAIATDEEGGEEAEQHEGVGIRFNKSRVDRVNKKNGFGGFCKTCKSSERSSFQGEMMLP